MRAIGVGVIGLGGMGQHDVQILKGLPTVKRLVGVDKSPEQCAKVKERFQIETTTNLNKVWQDPEIELVFITAPNATHVPLAIAALKHGKKVMTEKPVGLKWSETQRFLKAIKDTNGFAQVGFECRNYSKLFVRMKEIIDSGEIGKVRHMHLLYVNPPFTTHTESERWKFSQKVAGGIFPEKLCHYIDLMRWWAGCPVTQFFCTKAENTVSYFEIADNTECSVKFADGTVGHITFMMGPAHLGNPTPTHCDIWEQRNQGYSLNYRIIGTHGALESATFFRELRVFYLPDKPGFNGNAEMVRVERWKPEEDLTYFHNTPDQTADIVRRVCCGEPPAIAPADAAESMRLCFLFEKAMASPKWRVVNVPPAQD